ncbi:TPA: hypothetical protein U1C85_001022 [Streptococcus suis]|nr:hypothetical protein [Streptococcus suis]
MTSTSVADCKKMVLRTKMTLMPMGVFFMSTKAEISQNVRHKGKCFAIKNQKNADFLKFRQQKKPSRSLG